MGYAISALFFARFWSRSRDSLFLAFAAAFVLLAVAQALVTIAGLPDRASRWLYLLRLAAFLSISAAILRKNIKDERHG